MPHALLVSMRLATCQTLCNTAAVARCVDCAAEVGISQASRQLCRDMDVTRAICNECFFLRLRQLSPAARKVFFARYVQRQPTTAQEEEIRGYFREHDKDKGPW